MRVDRLAENEDVVCRYRKVASERSHVFMRKALAVFTAVKFATRGQQTDNQNRDLGVTELSPRVARLAYLVAVRSFS